MVTGEAETKARMSVIFQTMDSLPIGVTSDSVMAAFQPFLCDTVEQGQRRRLIRRIRYNAVKRAARRIIGRDAVTANRGKAMIADEYEGAWSRGYSAYDLSVGCRKPEPWVYRDMPVMADRSGVPRFRSVILSGVIRALKPSRVLEVGCGNGINLLLLANSFPDIVFTGIELTDSGNRVAQALQTKPTLPDALSRYAPGEQADPQAFRRIDFRKGDATAMPFESNAFDLVFTVLSVEQMERVRDKALSEIARVSGGHVLNLEPFAEANRSPWRRLHVFARDYFRGSVEDLPRYGLEPVWATMDYPQEVQLGAALVLSAKHGKA